MIDWMDRYQNSELQWVQLARVQCQQAVMQCSVVSYLRTLQRLSSTCFVYSLCLCTLVPCKAFCNWLIHGGCNHDFAQVLFGALCKESHQLFQLSQSEMSEERQKENLVRNSLPDNCQSEVCSLFLWLTDTVPQFMLFDFEVCHCLL